MAQRSGTNTLMLTAIAGLTGAAIALLFAPRSGRETREHIRDKAVDMKDKSAEKWDEAQDKLRSGKARAHDLKERLTDAAKKTRDTARDEYEQTREELDRESKRRNQIVTAWEEEV